MIRISFAVVPNDQFVLVTSALLGGVNGKVVLPSVMVWNALVALVIESSKQRGTNGVGGGVASTGIILIGGGLNAPLFY